MTLQLTANYRVKHLNSGFEQTRRGIILLVLLIIQPKVKLLYRFLIVFGNFFQLKHFRLGFFNKLEKYSPFELGSIIFSSKKQKLRKKLGRT